LHREHDAYRILQIDPRAERFVLEAAYRALARQYHPDGRAPDLQRMATINRAYAMVRTPDDRRRYDGERLQPVGPGPVVVPPVQFDPWARQAAAQAAAPPAGSSVLDFGRYFGWTLGDLAREDPDYLRWLARHSAGFRYRDEIHRLLPEDAAMHRRAKAMR
jgi:DnaJ-class molecular chaperone